MSKSTEYKLLKDKRDIVEKAICTDLKWISQQLNRDEAGVVLTDAEYDNMTNTRNIIMTEEDKAGFVCKRLLQRVDQDPEALKMFVKILMVKQAKFRPVILELGGDVPAMDSVQPAATPPSGGISAAHHIKKDDDLDLETVDGSELDRDDDLIEVVDSVQRLAASWSKLALYIHVKSDAIKTIEQNHPRDAQQCLLESIMEWLKKNYNIEKFGHPSWRMLVRAVKRLDNALANDIANAHGGMKTASETVSETRTASGDSSSSRTATQGPNVLNRPVTLPRLNIIKWRDENGVDQRLSLLEDMSMKWKPWGETVGISAAKLDGFEKQYHYNSKECMGAAARVWLQMESKQYPSTWNGLISLLEDIGDMGKLISKLRQAADDPNSNLHTQ